MSITSQWPEFSAALGIDPNGPQSLVAGTFRLHHGPLTALQICRKHGPDGRHEWVPQGPSFSVEQLSDPGGVFWRPACPGGHVDRAFAGSHLLFYEIDDLPLDGQWTALQRLEGIGLRPAAVVFSGGKSLHVYYRLTAPLAADQWRRVMRKLAIAQNSDPAIVSLSRLMRLPGARRFKNGQWVEQSIERLDPTAIHTLDEFEAALDGLGLWPHGVSDERWRLWRSQRGSHRHSAPALTAPDAILFPPRPAPRDRDPLEYDGQTIPLERCLSRRERDWLAGGIPQGERNPSGLVLGRSLVGTANWLDSHGYRYSGDPESLFWDCLRGSGLGDREIQTLWRSVNRGTPRPSLPDDALEACIASVIRPALPITPPQWQRPATETATGGSIVPWDPYNRLRNRFVWFDEAAAWSVEDWENAGRPVIQHRPEQRQQMWRWARDNGFVHALDSSPPGTGKSWDAGIFLEARVFPQTAPDADGDEGEGRGGHEQRPPCGWLLDSDPYNPSCETTAALSLQPGKHSGLVKDGDRVRVARDGDENLIQGPSCNRAQTFIAAAAQGHPQIAGKDCSLCQSCPRAEIERDGDGPDAPIKSLTCSFLTARRELNDSGRPRRAHPQTATVEPGDVVISDETEAITDTTAQTVRAGTLHTEIANLRHSFPALAAVAAPAIAVAMDAIADKGRFGVSSGTLHHRLLAVGPAIWTAWVEAGLGAVDGDPWETDPAPSPHRAIARAFQLDLEKLAQGDADAAIAAAIAAAPTARTIAVLVAAALGDTQGVSISADHGELTIARRNARALANTRKGAFNLHLDATATAQTLASHLGMGPGHILEMRAVGMSYSNMEIVALQGVGAMGSQREDGNTRAIALVDAIAEKHGEIAVMDRKSRESDYADIPGIHFGAHHRDGRKTNRFQHCRAIAIVGRPCPNLGALAAQWQAKTGQHIPDPAALTGRYGQWVRHKITAEIIQEVERLRGGRRDDPVTIYLVWDVADSELQAVARAFTGATIARRHAAGLTADGAKGAARRLLPFAEFLRANPDATIDAVATALGVTKGTVSKLAAPWGGFRAISQSFQFLYKPYIENGNFSETQAQSGIRLINALGWEIPRPAPAAAPEPAPAMDPTPTYRPGDRVWRWIDGQRQPYQLVEQPLGHTGWRCHHIDRPGDMVYVPLDRLAPMAPAIAV